MLRNLDRSRYTTARVIHARWFKSMYFFDLPPELRYIICSYIICETRDLGQPNFFDVPDIPIGRPHTLPRLLVSRCPRVETLLLSKQFTAEIEDQIRLEGGRHLSIGEEWSDVFQPVIPRVRPIYTLPKFFLSFRSIEIHLKIIFKAYVYMARLTGRGPHMLMRLWWLEDILDQMVRVRQCVVNLHVRVGVCIRVGHWVDTYTTSHIYPYTTSHMPLGPARKTAELAVARSVSGYTNLPQVTEVKMLAPWTVGKKVLLRWTRNGGYDEENEIGWDADAAERRRWEFV